MNDDPVLLRRYADEGHEPAFTELVERHISLVYYAALRRTQDPHLAEDVTQQVFIILARNASSLSRHAILAGWLYTTTRFAANRVLRTENRRTRHEREAYAMQITDPQPRADWERVRPALDSVMDKLSETERAAIILRYFEAQSFANVGRALRLTEEAARKRVARTIEKLRSLLADRGIDSSSDALEELIAGEARLAPPAGLISAVVGPALLAGAGMLQSGSLSLFRMGAFAKSALGTAAIIGAAALSVPLIGVTVRYIGARNRADAAVAAGNQAWSGEMAQFRDLRRQLGMLDRGGPSGAGADAGDVRAELRARGQEFMATYPQVRALLADLNEAAFLKFAPFFRQANLPPDQKRQFETLVSNRWIDHIAESTGVVAIIGPNADLTEEQVANVIGNEAAQKWIANGLLQIPYKTVALAAMAASEAGVPLTGDQSDALARIIAANSAPFQRRVGTMDPINLQTAIAAVDWDAAIAQSKALLPAAQFAAVQGTLLQQQYLGAVVNARKYQ